jgi:hypothetical protein
VRDLRAGWRVARLDVMIGGDFHLLGASARAEAAG